MEKKDNLSEWYHNILEKADIVDSRNPVKGMLIYKKWGVHIIREMQRYLEDLLEVNGHEPTLFPVLIPEDTLGKETAHIAGFEEEVFWVTHAGKNKLDRRLALRPTSETAIYDMFSLWIRAHTDLPMKVHQSCAVYRYETKHTRPLIRGREFLWNEGHAAHADAEDAEKNVELIKNIYTSLIQEFLCLPFIIDERPEWDKFPGAQSTYAFDTLMPDGRTLQIATVHNLGQNFSKVFGIDFIDANGEHRYVYQTTYGPGFGRLLAAAISIHGDEKGLILPPRVAPVQLVIVPIVFKESQKPEIIGYAQDIEKELRSMGIRVVVDDGDERPGAKYYRWEMKGVPLRVEVGPRDLKDKKITLVRRDNSEKSTISCTELDSIPSVFDSITEHMRETANASFKKGRLNAENVAEIKDLSGKGIINSGWCGKEECKEEIEKHASILCKGEGPATCAVCKKAGKAIRIAKTY